MKRKVFSCNLNLLTELYSIYLQQKFNLFVKFSKIIKIINAFKTTIKNVLLRNVQQRYKCLLDSIVQSLQFFFCLQRVFFKKNRMTYFISDAMT